MLPRVTNNQDIAKKLQDTLQLKTPPVALVFSDAPPENIPKVQPPLRQLAVRTGSAPQRESSSTPPEPITWDARSVLIRTVPSSTPKPRRC